MQLRTKFNKGFRFLLCVIDIFSKYAWVVPLKDKKGISIVNAFQKFLKQSSRKPSKIYDIVMYSTHVEGKSVAAERFIRTVKKQNLQIHDFNIKKCVY